MENRSPKGRALLTVLVCMLLFIVYQQCSVGGNEGGITNLPSGGPTVAPTLQLDSAPVTLPLTQKQMVVTGDCNPGSYPNYVFEAVYTERGSPSSSTKRFYENCVSGRFSLTVIFVDLQIVAGTPGSLAVALVGLTSSGEIPSSQAVMGISWAVPATTVCGTLQSGHGCKCTNITNTNAPSTFADCAALCGTNRANCCEWNNGTCWFNKGTACSIYTSSITGNWWASTCH